MWLGLLCSWGVVGRNCGNPGDIVIVVDDDDFLLVPLFSRLLANSTDQIGFRGAFIMRGRCIAVGCQYQPKPPPRQKQVQLCHRSDIQHLRFNPPKTSSFSFPAEVANLADHDLTWQTGINSSKHHSQVANRLTQDNVPLPFWYMKLIFWSKDEPLTDKQWLCGV
ncbi:hypothetical protein DER46DRAFT_589084 [Fusarium sp. MPI-SDFR-AT-0072]|nr:hypothetical protein DER46DRAFT_589084 [Fusarium sp. MPI-SDFR-AT-0072]